MKNDNIGHVGCRDPEKNIRVEMSLFSEFSQPQTEEKQQHNAAFRLENS